MFNIKRVLHFAPSPFLCPLYFQYGCGCCSWENTSLLCQVDSEASLESWAHALDEAVDLRPQQVQSEEDKAKVDIELKAKEAWTTREDGLWGGL